MAAAAMPTWARTCRRVHCVLIGALHVVVRVRSSGTRLARSLRQPAAPSRRNIEPPRQREMSNGAVVAPTRRVWYHEPMTDLTADRVRALADALDVRLSADDVDEVTHRLNAV